MKSELWPHQTQALENIRDSVRQGVKRLMVQMPTGAGKTLLAAAIVEGAIRKNNRTAFVVPRISLVDQTIEKLWNEGITDVGVIQAQHQLSSWHKPVLVCSIQTLRSRKVYPAAQVVVYDEAHEMHAFHLKWMHDPAWANVPFIGLSATPFTRGLGRHFESLLIGATTKELIQQGYLSKFRVFAADHPDLSNVKIVAGEYHEKQLSAAMQEAALTANIIETWKRLWGKPKTLLFAVDCAHGQMLQQRFHDAGIACAYQDARTPDTERKDIERGFHNGRYPVVVNIDTLSMGIDWDVRCLVLARPTRSEIKFVQIIGRSLRTAEGKDFALILDHTDTTSRLGFVTDIHHEHLSRGKLDENKKVPRKPALPRPCPQCACLMPAGVAKCPSCGHERKLESKVFEREGELVEFNGQFRKKGDRERYTYSPSEKARFYAQLKGYALMKGKKVGWAFYLYQEKFHTEPPWDIKGVTPMQPGPEVMQFMTHLNIQWARKKRDEPRQQSAV